MPHLRAAARSRPLPSASASSSSSSASTSTSSFVPSPALPAPVETCSFLSGVHEGRLEYTPTYAAFREIRTYATPVPLSIRLSAGEFKKMEHSIEDQRAFLHSVGALPACDSERVACESASRAFDAREGDVPAITVLFLTFGDAQRFLEELPARDQTRSARFFRREENMHKQRDLHNAFFDAAMRQPGGPVAQDGLITPAEDGVDVTIVHVLRAQRDVQQMCEMIKLAVAVFCPARAASFVIRTQLLHDLITDLNTARATDTVQSQLREVSKAIKSQLRLPDVCNITNAVLQRGFPRDLWDLLPVVTPPEHSVEHTRVASLAKTVVQKVTNNNDVVNAPTEAVARLHVRRNARIAISVYDISATARFCNVSFLVSRDPLVYTKSVPVQFGNVFLAVGALLLAPYHAAVDKARDFAARIAAKPLVADDIMHGATNGDIPGLENALAFALRPVMLAQYIHEHRSVSQEMEKMAAMLDAAQQHKLMRLCIEGCATT